MNEEDKKALAAEVVSATQEAARGMIKSEVAEAVVDPETVEKMARAVADKIPAPLSVSDKAASARKEMNENLRQLAEDKKGQVRANIIGDELPAATTLTGHGKELVQETTVNTVLMPHDWNGLVDRYAYNFQMPSNSVRVPTIDAVSANINDEGDVLGYRGISTGMLGIKSYTISVIVPMTKQFVRNAQVDVYSMLTHLSRQAFAKLRDQLVFGMLDGQATDARFKDAGIFTNTNIARKQLESGNTKFTDLKLEDLLTAYGSLDADASPMFVAHRSVLTNLAIEKNQAGNYIWDWSLYAQKRMPLFGMNFEESKLLPSTTTASQAGTDFAFMADFSDVIHGWDKEVTVEISDQAVLTNIASENRTVQLDAFQDELVFFKVTSYEGFALYRPEENFIVVKTAAS